MYAVWKFLHLLGVVLMLGNVIATGLWAHWALAQPEGEVPAFAAKAILWADVWLTFVGGTLLTIGGLLMVLQGGWAWSTPWLVQGILALVASTGLWLGALLPDQFRMKRLAAAQDWPALRRVYRRWAVLGWGATFALVYGLWAMVAKGA